MKLKQIALAAAIATTGSVAFAQSSSVTIYGNIDQNITYNSANGKSLIALEDGGFLKSRLGFKGVEDIGGGNQVKFTLESGGTANTGAFGTAPSATASPTSSGAFFDRQAWVGVATSIGEFRAGLQNTAIFYRGSYIDYTERTLGSIVNNFGVPSRYANDLSYISPRINGFLAELHYAPSGTAGDTTGNTVMQYALDYENGPARIGYAGISAKPLSTAANQAIIKYDNYYVNYDYGKGKVAGVYINTNNLNTSSGTMTAPLGTVGTLVNLGSSTYPQGSFDIFQLSVDYRVSPQLRIGTLWGQIHDKNGTKQGSQGGSVGGYYDLSKRTTVYGIAQTFKNEDNAGYTLAGSAGLTSKLSTTNVTGQTVVGYTVGILHRF